MKKLVLAAAIAAASFSVPAFAAEPDATLRVDGSVQPVCTISAGADVQNIVLSSSTASLGDIALQCNDWQGFTVGFKSDKGGKLTTEDANPTFYTYKIDTPFTSPTAPTVAEQTVSFGDPAFAAAAVNGVNIPLTLTDLTRNGANFAGFYFDYVNFSITAN